MIENPDTRIHILPRVDIAANASCIGDGAKCEPRKKGSYASAARRFAQPVKAGAEGVLSVDADEPQFPSGVIDQMDTVDTRRETITRRQQQCRGFPGPGEVTGKKQDEPVIRRDPDALEGGKASGNPGDWSAKLQFLQHARRIRRLRNGVQRRRPNHNSVGCELTGIESAREQGASRDDDGCFVDAAESGTAAPGQHNQLHETWSTPSSETVTVAPASTRSIEAGMTARP